MKYLQLLIYWYPRPRLRAKPVQALARIGRNLDSLVAACDPTIRDSNLYGRLKRIKKEKKEKERKREKEREREKLTKITQALPVLLSLLCFIRFWNNYLFLSSLFLRYDFQSLTVQVCKRDRTNVECTECNGILGKRGQPKSLSVIDSQPPVEVEIQWCLMVIANDILFFHFFTLIHFLIIIVYLRFKKTFTSCNCGILSSLSIIYIISIIFYRFRFHINIYL